MVLFLFGIPGRFDDWCHAAITRIAEMTVGPLTAVSPASPEELGLALIEAEGSNVLVKGFLPGAWVRRILVATNKPSVICLNDPRRAARELISNNGLELADAARWVGSSCALIVPCISLPGALVLHADRDWHRPGDAVQALARHFGLAIEPVDSHRIAAELAAAGLGPQDGSSASDPNQLPEPGPTILNGAVDSYLNYFSGSSLGPITWFRELFFTDNHQPAAHAVDMTGRVRSLIYGPYFRLPPGKWAAEMVLGFSQEAADMSFVVDVKSTVVDLKTGESVLGSTSIRPAQQGVFSVNLSFMIGEENDHPIEFRVINERAAFEGRVMLGHVTLSLQHDPSGTAGALLLKADLGLLP
jgi:hypothetical protein